MPLLRYEEIVIWDAELKAAGSMTPYIDVSRVSHWGIFFRSSTANYLRLYVKRGLTWEMYDRWEILADTPFWLNVWSFPYGQIYFYIESEATLTLSIYKKIVPRWLY